MVSQLPQSAADLQQIYRERFSGTLEYRQRVWKELTSRCFSAWVPADSVVLDLGCGYCEFINNIQARKKFGMDLNPDSVQNAAPGVNIIQQDCSQTWQVPGESLDFVFKTISLELSP